MSGDNPQCCPACGRDNSCAVARAGNTEVHCWCMELATPLRIAPEMTHQDPDPGSAACFCRDCATNEKAPAVARAFPSGSH